MSNKNHVHVWEWNVPPEALDCMKCGEYLDCGNIVEHINALESQLAARDALIERLVEAGQMLADELPYGANEEIVNKFDTLCDEWQAMKGGEE